MDYQLRLVYRRSGSGPSQAWAVVIHRDKRRKTWAWRGEVYTASGNWAEATALPRELVMTGVRLEDGTGKVLHEAPALEAVVASHQHLNYNPFRRWDAEPDRRSSDWVLGIDPTLPSTAPMRGEEDKVWVQVWVRVPSFLMAFGDTPAQTGAQNDYLWLNYNLTGGSFRNSTKVRYALAAGEQANLWNQVTEDSNAAKPSYFEGEMPGFCERALGVRASKAPLRCFWETSSRGHTVLVMRRQFLTTAYAAPFMNHEKEYPLILEQRATKSVLELARGAVPWMPPRKGGSDAVAQAWAVQPQIFKEENGAGRAWTQVGNEQAGSIFSAGWAALMATWEPHLDAKPVLLFHLEPTNKIKYNPFPLLLGQTCFRQSEDVRKPDLQMRLVAEPPKASNLISQAWRMHFPALRSHANEMLTCEAGLASLYAVQRGDLTKHFDKGSFVRQPQSGAWLVKMDLKPKSANKSKMPHRIGGLDLSFGGDLNVPPTKGGETNQKNTPANCFFILRHPRQADSLWNCYVPLQLVCWGVGYDYLLADHKTDHKTDVRPLEIPLLRVSPGGTDTQVSETPLFAEDGGQRVAEAHPFILSLPLLTDEEKELAVNKGKVSGNEAPPSDKALLKLEISQVQGLTFTEVVNLSIHQTGQINNTNELAFIQERLEARLWYLDRTPFFNCILDTRGETNIALEDSKAGSQWLYYSNKGADRGWQRRAASGVFLMVLPPQGIGEAMEKGRKEDGYRDIEENERVDIRFCGSTLLFIESSDRERNYYPLPWNIRSNLNGERTNRLVGLPLKMASFEMLYGLRFTLDQVPFLRVAELMSRMGSPRKVLAPTPVYDGNPYMTADGDGNEVYKNHQKWWHELLQCMDSRLAVYEVFDDRQLEFKDTGELGGLVVEGGRNGTKVTAELRKSARLRTSIPAVQGEVSGENGNFILLTDVASPPVNPNETEEDAKKRKTKEKAKRLEHLATSIPNYEDGLAGSFAWAFESRLIYEMLWQDPLKGTPAVVESVEASVARLYFSALGGWGTQKATFANGRIIIAVAVEMGRVSELRVEVVGRVATMKNRAKLVTVFRRTVLPNKQFVDQQDRHEGRPLLRKTEEYVEFIEQYRLLQDVATVDVDAGLPGCVKACSCHERILVDSRWGSDLYSAQQKGLGWKVPLRKVGASPRIYGPANVLLHCHTHGKAEGDCAGRIENLDNLWFYTLTDEKLSDDTDQWPDVKGLDLLPEPQRDKDIQKLENKSQDLNKPQPFGAAAVPTGAARMTYRLAGMSLEANLSHHLPPDPTVPPDQQRSVGSVLRYVTLFRQVPKKDPEKKQSQQEAEQLPKPQTYSRSEMAASADAVQSHVESTLAVLEQFTTRRTTEAVLGWDIKTDFLKKVGADTLDALKPVAAMAKQLDVQVDALTQYLRKEAGHLVTDVSEWMNAFKTSGISAAIENAGDKGKALQALQTAVDNIKKDVVKKVSSFEVELEKSLKPAYNTAKELEKQAREFITLIHEKLEIISKEFSSADSEVQKQIKILTERKIREFLKGALEHFESSKWEVSLESILRESLAYAVGLHTAKLKAEEVQAYLAKVAKVLVVEHDKLAEAWLKVRQVTINTQNLPAAFIAVMAGKNNAVFTYRLEIGLTAKVTETTQILKAKVEAFNTLIKSELAIVDEKLQSQILAWLDEVSRPGRVPDWKAIAPIKAHLKALEAGITVLGQDMSQKVDRLCSEAARGADILKRPVNELSGALGMVQGWVDHQKREAGEAWKKLKDSLGTDFAPLGKVQKSIRDLTSKAGDVEGIKKQLENQLVTNVTETFRRADREIRGLAMLVNDSFLDPLQRLKEALASSEQELIPKLLAEIERRKLQLIGEEGSWGKVLSSIRGTAEQVKAALENGQESLIKLKDVFAKQWPFTGAIPQILPEKSRRLALAEVRRIIIIAEKLELTMSLPWLRSLPNHMDCRILLPPLKRMEWSLDAAQGGLDSKFSELRVDLAKHVKDLELHTKEAIDLINHSTFAELKKGLDSKLNSLMKATGDAQSKLTEELQTFCLSFEDKLADQIQFEAETLSNVFKDKYNVLVGDVSTQVNELKGRLAKELKDLPGIEFFERGLPEAQAWFDLQRQTFLSQMDGLATLKEEFVDAAGGAGMAAAKLFRTFGRVPEVPGLDFNDIASFAKGEVEAEFKAGLANLSNRMRNIGCEFMNDVGDYVRMSPVTAMVDRSRNALNEVAEEARLKAASLEMAVRDVRRRLEADVNALKDKALKDLIPDFGAIKLEKLLGAAGVSEKFVEDLKARSKLSHGFDEKTLSGWVDSQVEDLELTDSLTLFSLGPVALNLKKAKLNSSLRIATNAKGETEKNGQGSIVADWEVCMGGQPLLTYAQAKLECINGRVNMELDPQKVRMPSMLQMLADTMAAYSHKDDSGLVAGVRVELPREVTGFATFNLDFPPIGAGTTSIQNLRLALFFELSLTFPRFPSLTDAGLRISAGAALSDKSAPFIIAIFILGGCGWFRMRLDYVVPFKDGSPYLQAEIDVALGASASLCLNLGFATGQVFIALAVELQCLVGRGRSNMRFSFVLTIAGVLDILGGLISAYMVVTLSISYASGQPMRGRGRICISIRICWCVKIKVDKTFTYTFGKSSDGSATGARSAGDASFIPRLAEQSPDRIRVQPVYQSQPAPAPVMPPPPPHAHRRAGRMVV